MAPAPALDPTTSLRADLHRARTVCKVIPHACTVGAAAGHYSPRVLVRSASVRDHAVTDPDLGNHNCAI